MRMVRIVCVTCGTEKGKAHYDGCAGKFNPHWKPIIVHKRG